MKKSIAPFLLLPILILFFIPSISHSLNWILTNTPTQVYFSPNEGCTEVIIQQIENAKSEILVQAYSFTFQPIAKALLSTHK
jgi:hypothetical protein